MYATTKKQKKITKKGKKVQVYLFLSCKLAFAFMKNHDISRIPIDKIYIFPSP